MIDRDLPARVLDLAVAIQQIASPTFEEQQRGSFVQQCFLDEGLAEISRDEVGNIYGCWRGKTSQRSIVVSAHLDTVFPASTDLSVRRSHDRITGPGIGDNSLGVAGLLGLVWLLKRTRPLNADVWLVANVGEEGLGDLRGIKAVVDRFSDGPKAYLILEGMVLGIIFHRGLGVQRFRITARTTGGHSWVDYGRPSAIHELARLVTRLEELPVPKTPEPGMPRSSYNVGVLNGGTSVNTIAAEAWLELDIRSEDEAYLAHLAEQVKTIARLSSRTGEFPVEFSVESIGRRLAGEIPSDHRLVQAARRELVELGLIPKLDIGSTDANYPLSRGYPAVCVGLTYGNGAHTFDETIDTAPLGKGLEQVLRLVRAVDRWD